jgi:hypothetical protein
MPGTTFKRFIKCTQRTATPPATGDFDFPLPIGNLLRGVGVFTTTRYLNLNTPGSLDDARILVNNTERLWTGGQFSLANYFAMARWAPHPSQWEAGLIENVAGAYAQFASTTAVPIATADWADNYGYLDLDPTRDDACSFNTVGVERLNASSPRRYGECASCATLRGG